MPDTDPQNPETSEAIVDEGESAESGGSGSAGATEAKDAASGDPLEQARAEAAKLKDQWLRTAADFDNFRKRSRREVEDAKKSGREDLLRAVLPVFDNLERAIQSATRTNDVKAVADGLTMVLRQFHDALGRTGIQKVPTVGHPFDPSVHEAIQQVETADHPAGTVIAEVQPGYVQGDRLIRAALVVVAKGQEGKRPADDGSGQPTN